MWASSFNSDWFIVNKGGLWKILANPSYFWLYHLEQKMDTFYLVSSLDPSLKSYIHILCDKLYIVRYRRKESTRKNRSCSNLEIKCDIFFQIDKLILAIGWSNLNLLHDIILTLKISFTYQIFVNKIHHVTIKEWFMEFASVKAWPQSKHLAFPLSGCKWVFRRSSDPKKPLGKVLSYHRISWVGFVSANTI